METKKILGIIFSIVFISAFAFVLTWGIINFNKVKQGMSGTELYTQEDLNNAYEDGYGTALQDKDEYDKLISGYRDNITELNDTISKLNSQVIALTNSNKDYSTQISGLNTQKENLQSQVDNLTSIKESNEETIEDLSGQIKTLNNKVSELTNDKENNEKEITELNKQVDTLTTLCEQLRKTNSLNLETINNLNDQIALLNSQISDFTLQIQNNSSNVSSLTSKIAELEKSVAYYEQYIQNLESGEQCVVTFEFNGSVYNIQVVNKNSLVTVVDPESTEFIIFNYWTVGGEKIDLKDYRIISNTRIIANVTYKYKVEFKVDNDTHNSQIIVKNGHPSVPDVPSKAGYEFDGWTLNGVDVVNVPDQEITQDTIFFAKFTQLHTVTFSVEGDEQTKQVRNGECVEPIEVESTDYKVFNGWKLDNTIVNLTTYKITADVTFVADFTYKYDVKFMVDDTEHDTQIIAHGSYANIPALPQKDGYEFAGWTLNGEDVVNVATIQITQTTTFKAKFNKIHKVTFTYEDGVISTQNIINGNYASNVSVESTTYKVFNGWKVNGEIVNIATYKITQDTNFVADITYKYDVVFKVDSSTINSQIVERNKNPYSPGTPSKSGMVFKGWTLNGNDVVDITTYKVTANTTFIAKFKYDMSGNYTLTMPFAKKVYSYKLDFSIVNNQVTIGTIYLPYNNAGNMYVQSSSVSGTTLTIVVSIGSEYNQAYSGKSTLTFNFNEDTGTWAVSNVKNELGSGGGLMYPIYDPTISKR